MVIAELVGSGIEFPAQRFSFFFYGQCERWTVPWGLRAKPGGRRENKGRKKNNRWNGSQELLPPLCQCGPGAMRHMAAFSILLRSKFNTCTTPSLMGQLTSPSSAGPLPLPLANSAASIRDAAGVRGRRWASTEQVDEAVRRMSLCAEYLSCHPASWTFKAERPPSCF